MKALWLILKLNFMTWLPMLADALAFIKRNLFPILFALLIALVLLLSWRLDNSQQALSKAKSDHAAELQAIDLNNARLLAQYQETARVKTQSWQRRVDDANQKAEQKAADLRVLTDDLSDAQRLLNKAIAARSFKRDADIASGTPVAATDTNGALLSDCAARYSELAVKADGHVIDVQRLLDAWPVDSEEAQ